MKKILSIVMLSLVAVIMFSGCKGREIGDIPVHYVSPARDDEIDKDYDGPTLEDYYSTDKGFNEMTRELKATVDGTNESYKAIDFNCKGNEITYLYHFNKLKILTEEQSNNFILGIAEGIDKAKDFLSKKSGVPAKYIRITYEYYNYKDDLIMSARF